MFRVLVAEDDPVQRRMMADFLHLNDYEVFTAEDGLDAYTVLQSEKVDLVLCDLMMPRMNGIELTRAIRELDPYLPILTVTAKGDFSDKQLAFLGGTDDYMVKPVDLDELLLRVKALFRRARIQQEHKITVGQTVVSNRDWTVETATRRYTLPKKEFQLLFMMLSYPGILFTRRQLMDEIWGVDCETNERTVDVHVRRLREKLAGVADFDIVTVRGLGYRAEVSRNA